MTLAWAFVEVSAGEWHLCNSRRDLLTACGREIPEKAREGWTLVDVACRDCRGLAGDYRDLGDAPHAIRVQGVVHGLVAIATIRRNGEVLPALAWRCQPWRRSLGPRERLGTVDCLECLATKENP